MKLICDVSPMLYLGYESFSYDNRDFFRINFVCGKDSFKEVALSKRELLSKLIPYHYYKPVFEVVQIIKDNKLSFKLVLSDVVSVDASLVEDGAYKQDNSKSK